MEIFLDLICIVRVKHFFFTRNGRLDFILWILLRGGIEALKAGIEGSDQKPVITSGAQSGQTPFFRRQKVITGFLIRALICRGNSWERRWEDRKREVDENQVKWKCKVCVYRFGFSAEQLLWERRWCGHHAGYPSPWIWNRVSPPTVSQLIW